MGTIIGAKTCTWQQQRATKTTTTRLNLRTAQTTTTKSSLCVWNKNKTTIFPRRRKVHSLCPPIDCDARRGQNNVEHFTAGEALTAIAATVVTGPKRVLGVIIRLR